MVQHQPSPIATRPNAGIEATTWREVIAAARTIGVRSVGDLCCVGTCERDVHIPQCDTRDFTLARFHVGDQLISILDALATDYAPIGRHERPHRFVLTILPVTPHSLFERADLRCCVSRLLYGRRLGECPCRWCTDESRN